ncbi:MAG: hypothetical protein NVS2B7_05920 [Herpetosiphon sp.]
MESLVGGGISALLTLLILSRSVADNVGYRLAQHLFIGAALGYSGAVTLRTVVGLPVQRAITGQSTLPQLLILGTGALLGLALAARFGRSRLGVLANVPLALLFGIGAALVLVGGLRGTLVPQMLATMRLQTAPDWTVQAGVAALVALTIIVLAGFVYGTGGERARLPVRITAALGRVAILATFGVFLAAGITTYMAALVGRTTQIIKWIQLVVGVA